MLQYLTVVFTLTQNGQLIILQYHAQNYLPFFTCLALLSAETLSGTKLHPTEQSLFRSTSTCDPKPLEIPSNLWSWRSCCPKWQTAGRQWHALLAKYSTPCSNSAERENIDTVIQGPPLQSELLRGKTSPAGRHTCLYAVVKGFFFCYHAKLQI